MFLKEFSLVDIIDKLEKENLSLKKKQEEDGIIILQYDDWLKDAKAEIEKLEAVYEAVIESDANYGCTKVCTDMRDYKKRCTCGNENISKAIHEYETWKGGKDE